MLPNCAILTLTPGSVPTALAGAAFSQTFTVTGARVARPRSRSQARCRGLLFSNGVLSGRLRSQRVPVTITGTDANACQASASCVTVSPERRLVVGAGGGPSPYAFRPNGTIASEFAAYTPGFTGGVPVAQADVNGDGVVDIITGAGPGGTPHVKVFDGATGLERLSFLAYPSTFTGGIEVAAGDVTGDGLPEILVTPGCAGPIEARAFDARTGALVRVYVPVSTWTCGLHVAAGDVNGDGLADVILGAGAGSGPFVAVLDGGTGATLRQFLAYPSSFNGGVYVAAADITGDGRADIVTGAARRRTARARLDGVTGNHPSGRRQLHAYTAAFMAACVAAGVHHDGRREAITAAGPGAIPHVRVFDGATGAGVYAFDPAMTGSASSRRPRSRASLLLISRRAERHGGAHRGLGAQTDRDRHRGTDVIHAWAYRSPGARRYSSAPHPRASRDRVANLFGESLTDGFDFTGTLAPGPRPRRLRAQQPHAALRSAPHHPHHHHPTRSPRDACAPRRLRSRRSPAAFTAKDGEFQ